MNIFEEYKNKILNIIKKAEKDKILILPENLNSINVDSTPPKIDFDLSTNVSMVLSKPNNKSPIIIADIIIDLLKKDDDNMDQISFAKPGFINIKFNKNYWNNFANKLIIASHNYGSSNIDKKKYLVFYFYTLQIYSFYRFINIYCKSISHSRNIVSYRPVFIMFNW